MLYNPGIYLNAGTGGRREITVLRNIPCWMKRENLYNPRPGLHGCQGVRREITVSDPGDGLGDAVQHAGDQARLRGRLLQSLQQVL